MLTISKPLSAGQAAAYHANYAFELRLATIDHFAALSGRSVRALWNRLLKLREHRYLASAARFMQKQVYGIGSEGVPVLIEHGYAPPELAEKRLCYHELTAKPITPPLRR
jgi:hypothetical protein